MPSELDYDLTYVFFVEGKQYCLYADNGYSERIYLQVTFQGDNLLDAQHAHNTAMSSDRVTVEWIFKEIKLYWTTVDLKRKMCVNQSPVGSMYTAAMLLTNFRNCLYPNTVSQYFNCRPLSLEEYLMSKD